MGLRVYFGFNGLHQADLEAHSIVPLRKAGIIAYSARGLISVIVICEESQSAQAAFQAEGLFCSHWQTERHLGNPSRQFRLG